jgi:fructose-bisphosphate aldolase, class II
MPLVSSQQLLSHAQANGYCLPGFDVFNFELLEGVLNACEKQRAPVIIQTSFMNFDFYDIERLSVMLIKVLERTTIPVTLHLDHGPGEMPIEVVKKVLKEGFPSVMADGSHLPLEENIQVMKKIKALATPYGAAVEGELGQVSRDPSISREEVRALMTDPDDASRFVEETGIDSLAVSVGSVTACFDTSLIEIDFPRLEKIADSTKIPLVFHGGTGIPDVSMEKAIGMGIAKCNVAHGLRKIYTDVLRENFKGTEGYVDPRPSLKETIDKISVYVEQKLQLFKCVGKADLFEL